MLTNIDFDLCVVSGRWVSEFDPVLTHDFHSLDNVGAMESQVLQSRAPMVSYKTLNLCIF